MGCGSQFCTLRQLWLLRPRDSCASWGNCASVGPGPCLSPHRMVHLNLKGNPRASCAEHGLQIATPWVFRLRHLGSPPLPLLRSLRSVYWALLIKLWTALPVPALPVTCPATWGLKNWLGIAQLVYQTWQPRACKKQPNNSYMLINIYPPPFIHYIHWDDSPFQSMIPYSVFHAVLIWFQLTWNCEI